MTTPERYLELYEERREAERLSTSKEYIYISGERKVLTAWDLCVSDQQQLLAANPLASLNEKKYVYMASHIPPQVNCIDLNEELFKHIHKRQT